MNVPEHGPHVVQLERRQRIHCHPDRKGNRQENLICGSYTFREPGIDEEDIVQINYHDFILNVD